MADNRNDPLPAVLAIDGGNSKTDVALIADDGTVLASVRGPGASHEDFGLRPRRSPTTPSPCSGPA